MADTWHVFPTNDLIVHEPEDCRCGPTLEAKKFDDGSVGWVAVNHSMDGREFTESDYAGPTMPRDHGTRRP